MSNGEWRMANVASAAIVVWAVCAPATRGEEPVDLCWKYAPGARFAYEETMEVVQTPQGLGTVFQTSTGREQTEEVEAVAEGGGVVRWTLTRLQLKAKLGLMGDIDYDSDRKEDAEKHGKHDVLQQYAPLIGVPVRFRSDPAGKVSDVSLGAAKLPPEVHVEAIVELLRDRRFELPGRPVRKGDHWTTQTDIPMAGLGGTIVRTRRCTFAGVEEREGRRVARIMVIDNFAKKEAAAGTGTAPPPANAPDDDDGALPQMSLDAYKGTGAGEVLFLIDEGALLEMRLESRSTLEASMGMFKMTQEMVEKSIRRRVRGS